MNVKPDRLIPFPPPSLFFFFLLLPTYKLFTPPTPASHRHAVHRTAYSPRGLRLSSSHVPPTFLPSPQRLLCDCVRYLSSPRLPSLSAISCLVHLSRSRRRRRERNRIANPAFLAFERDQRFSRLQAARGFYRYRSCATKVLPFHLQRLYYSTVRTACDRRRLGPRLAIPDTLQHRHRRPVIVSNLYFGHNPLYRQGRASSSVNGAKDHLDGACRRDLVRNHPSDRPVP